VKSISAIFIVCTILFSCTKIEEQYPKSNQSSKIPSNSIASLVVPVTYVSPSLNEIDSIGIRHNERLQLMISEFDYNRLDYAAYAEPFVKNYLNASDIFPEGEKQAFSVLSDPLNYISLNGTDAMILFSNSVTANLGVLVTFVQVQNYCAIKRKEVVTNSQMTQIEKDFCLIYLSTVEKSAYFWMSTDKGGSGQGDLFFDVIQELNPDVLARPLWEEVVAADGGGAGAAFLWIGISGLWAAPPAWPILVLDVGFNAAASSMFTYLNGIS
jgi:hypothetical protein